MPWPGIAPHPKRSKNSTASWMRTGKTTMTGLNSWLSPAVLHALGWALIHSLWQCAAIAAMAALAMAFIRRPAVRYLVGVGALALMLAAPVATFLVLASAPVPAQQPAIASVLPATPPPSLPVAVF